MKHELVLGKVSVTYDFDALFKDIYAWQYDKDTFTARSCWGHDDTVDEDEDEEKEELEDDENVISFDDEDDDDERESYIAAYSSSQSDFEQDRKSFIERLEALKDNPTKFEEAIRRNLAINKDGRVTKNRKNIIFTTQCWEDYSDEHGSHSYRTKALRLEPTGDFSAKLVVERVKDQSSF